MHECRQPVTFRLPHGNATFQFFEPAEDDLNLRSGRCCGLCLSGSDNTKESFAVWSDVVGPWHRRPEFNESSRHRHGVAERETRLRCQTDSQELIWAWNVEQLLPIGRPQWIVTLCVFRYLVLR